MGAAPLIQVLIRSIDETQAMPFVQAVRARGASESWIFWRNIFSRRLGIDSSDTCYFTI